MPQKKKFQGFKPASQQSYAEYQSANTSVILDELNDEYAGKTRTNEFETGKFSVKLPISDRAVLTIGTLSNPAIIDKIGSDNPEYGTGDFENMRIKLPAGHQSVMAMVIEDKLREYGEPQLDGGRWKAMFRPQYTHTPDPENPEVVIKRDMLAPSKNGVVTYVSVPKKPEDQKRPSSVEYEDEEGVRRNQLVSIFRSIAPKLDKKGNFVTKGGDPLLEEKDMKLSQIIPQDRAIITGRISSLNTNKNCMHSIWVKKMDKKLGKKIWKCVQKSGNGHKIYVSSISILTTERPREDEVKTINVDSMPPAMRRAYLQRQKEAGHAVEEDERTKREARELSKGANGGAGGAGGDSDSDSDEDVKPKKGKKNKKAKAKESSDDDSDAAGDSGDSDTDSEEDEDTKPKKSKGKSKANMAADSDDSHADPDDEEDADSKPKKPKDKTKDVDSGSDSDSDTDSDEDTGSDPKKGKAKKAVDSDEDSDNSDADSDEDTKPKKGNGKTKKKAADSDDADMEGDDSDADSDEEDTESKPKKGKGKTKASKRGRGDDSDDDSDADSEEDEAPKKSKGKDSSKKSPKRTRVEVDPDASDADSEEDEAPKKKGKKSKGKKGKID